MKAKAAIFKGVHTPFELKEYDITKPESGMARMELLSSGICGTDVHFYDGTIPLDSPKIIGHEFVGKVSEISDEDSERFQISKGDRVISNIAVPCGKCKLCKSGDDANCVNMGVTNGGNPEENPHFHGGFAEVSYAPVANLVKIPENVDTLAACVFACPGPTVIHAFRLAQRACCKLEEAETAVVSGTGPVGCMAIAYLASLEIKNIIVLANRESKESDERVRSLGATEILHIASMTDDDIISRIMSVTDGFGADAAFEASGNPKAVPLALKYLRNRGVYLVPGQYSNSGPVEIEPQLITFKALHIIGSSQYSMSDVRDYLDFLSRNPDLQKTIKGLASCYAVDEINQAFSDIKAHKNIKTVLVRCKHDSCNMCCR